MPTLYVRNVPEKIYAALQTWAVESGRSVNTLVLDLLEKEVTGRDRGADFRRRVDAMKAKYPPIPGERLLEDSDPELGR